jgi:hypothetical protein
VEGPSATQLALLLAALAILAALVQTIRLAWLRGAPGRAIRARAERGALGESRAEHVLAAAGYALVARQVRGAWTLLADGEPVDVQVRADLLVTKAGRSYVAEVKTGREAPRVDHIATRRQLLEYRVAFDVDGVVLVDAEAGRVVHVDVAGREASPPERATPRWAFAFVAGVALGVAIAAATVGAISPAAPTRDRRSSLPWTP